MIQFPITGQLKGGKDSIQTRRDGQRYPKPEFVAWRRDVIFQIKHFFNKCKRPIPYFTVPLFIGVEYWASDKKIRDVTAMLDGLFHVFEMIRLVKNDALFKSVDWQYKGIDRESPRAIVTIRTMERE